MSAAHFSNCNLQQYICQDLIYLLKNMLFQVNAHSVMVACTHITAHRKCKLDISM